MMEEENKSGEERCTYCEAALVAEDIDHERGLASCRKCHAVFGFGAGGPGKATRQRELPETPLPRGLSFDTRGDHLEIVRHWKVRWGWTYIVVGLVPLGLMASDPPRGFAPEMWPMYLLAAVLFLGFSFGFTYYGLLFSLNRTTIRVEQGVLTIRHGPLPWFGGRELSASDLLQLHCTEEPWVTRDGTVTVYSVEAVLRRGKRLRLVVHLPDPEQALFIEQAIEGHLGIVDRPV